jgi:hypothetical protein
MRDHSQSHLLLLLLGVFLLTQHAKLPNWLSYCVMLAVLGGTRQLAPEWFAQNWFDNFWRMCVAVAAGGLLLETGTLLLA